MSGELKFETGFDAKKALSGWLLATTGDDVNSASKALERLSTLQVELTQEIDRRVGAHYDDLLGQASSLRDAASMIREIAEGVQALQLALKRVKAELITPYERIKERTRQLQSLHDGAEIIRVVLRFAQLLRTLKEAASKPTELAKAANAHGEILSLLKENSEILTGVELVDVSREYLLRSGENLSASSERMLSQGLETLNQQDIAISLQALKSLGKLDDGTFNAVSSILEHSSISIAASLVDSSSTSSLSLWLRIGKITETISTAVSQAWALSTALNKARDSVSGEPLIQFSQKFKDESPVSWIWRSLCKVVSERISAASRQNPNLETSLVSEYPKLLKSFLELTSRISPSLNGINDSEDQLIQAILPFEKLYLSQTFTKLSEPINSFFVQQQQTMTITTTANPPFSGTQQQQQQALSPTNIIEGLQNVAKALAVEIESTRAIPRLTDAVGKQVIARTIKYVKNKAEPFISLNEAEAFQVRDRMTTQQIQNAAIFQSLVAAHAAFTVSMLPSRAWISQQSTIDVIDEAIKSIETTASSCVSKLFTNATKLLESSVYLIHSEDFSSDSLGDSSKTADANDQQTAASTYILAVDKQLRHFQMQFLTRLAPCQLLTALTTALCSRVITFFVRHAALVRPLGIRGKVRLAADMAQLELCIGRLLPAKTITTGDAYKQLHAFRTLMHRDLAEFASLSSQTLPPEAHLLPPNVLLHHLFSRTSQQQEVVIMQSPYTFARMSLAQYSEWIDKHSEAEIWNLIKSSLDSYAESVNKRGEKQFSQVYVVLQSLGPYLVSLWEKNQSQNQQITQ